MFNALVLTQVEGKTQAHIQALTTDDLPAGDGYAIAFLREEEGGGV